MASISTATQIFFGGGTAYALLADGTIRSWGLNTSGDLGNGTSGGISTTPVTVTGVGGVVQIAGGQNFAHAVRADGTVMAWGANDEGQLGDGTTTTRATAAVVPGLTGIRQVAGTFASGFALRNDGTVVGWGRGGANGDGTSGGRATPTPVVGISTAVQIATADSTACYALLSSGAIMAWGSGFAGQLGNGAAAYASTPVQVLDITTATSIGESGIAILADGSVRSWGWNRVSQVGDGTTTNRVRPVRLSLPAGAPRASALSTQSFSGETKFLITAV